jgi:hypothetical protein
MTLKGQARGILSVEDIVRQLRRLFTNLCHLVIENLGRHDQVCNLWNQAIERCNFIHTGDLNNTDPMYEGSLLARFWDHRGLGCQYTAGRFSRQQQCQS